MNLPWDEFEAGTEHQKSDKVTDSKMSIMYNSDLAET